MQKIQKQDLPELFQDLVKQTEDNIEQLLLSVHAMCPDDVPIIKWEGDEWQPDLLNDDIYPQFHVSDDFVHDESSGRPAPAKRYEVLWALPLCGRDQTKHWHDKIGLSDGTAERVLLFHWEFKALENDPVLRTSWLECSIGMFEGYRDQSRSVVSLFRNEHANSIPVTPALVVKLVKHIQDLHEHVDLEKRVIQIMRRMKEQHPLPG